MELPGTVVNVLKSTEDAAPGFAETACLPFLRQAQNADGGWGYHAGAASAVESTSWCLLALAKYDSEGDSVERGRRWLAGAQTGDGSWPTRPETREGNWLTALAGLAMLATGGTQQTVSRAAAWVCRSRSAEGFFRVHLSKLLVKKQVIDQDLSLRGWSWTPGTASWVEPTAMALIFLHSLPEDLIPAAAAERRRVGEAMLYDRMCASGGWNSGNPKVYGVEGIPQIGPTAWALLALQDQPEREESRRSLDWLASRFDSIDGPSSLALACLALNAGRRPVSGADQKLKAHFEAGDFLGSVMAYAQAAFALAAGPDLLRWTVDKD